MKDKKNGLFDFLRGSGSCGCGGGFVYEDDENEKSSDEKRETKKDEKNKVPVRKGCC